MDGTENGKQQMNEQGKNPKTLRHSQQCGGWQREGGCGEVGQGAKYVVVGGALSTQCSVQMTASYMGLYESH